MKSQQQAEYYKRADALMELEVGHGEASVYAGVQA
jgi:hypothetical protein